MCWSYGAIRKHVFDLKTAQDSDQIRLSLVFGSHFEQEDIGIALMSMSERPRGVQPVRILHEVFPDEAAEKVHHRERNAGRN